MRYHLLHILLLAAIGCCAGRPGMAQHTAVAPITPISPVVKLAGPQPTLGTSVSPGAAMRQPTAVVPRKFAGPQPLVILNSSVIIDISMSSINPSDIDKMTVYKGSDAPRQWQTLVNDGIIAITLKKGVRVAMKCRTLAAIGRKLNLSGPVSYTVNGMPIAKAKLRIAADAIDKIDVTPGTALQPTTLVDIRIINHIRDTPSNRPPGTILIRGTASL